MKPKRVLFLCTGNSARSQMAEGILKDRAGQEFEVYSAGISPKGLNPLAVESMKEIGIDISHHQSKDVETVIHKSFDWVITVCDHAKERCPIFPSARLIHWDIKDPETIQDFRASRDDISGRIDELLKRLKPREQ